MTLELVLAGAGHAHVEVLRRLAEIPDPGLRLKLVNPDPHTPYSGMLPGLIAGHYSWDECHIDLDQLCRRAGAQLVRGSVARLNAAGRTLVLDDGSIVPFELLSLNTGSTPETKSVRGASHFATPIKPMSGFLEKWNRMLKALEGSPDRPFSTAVVGAGAGGVEVALAIRHRLVQTGKKDVRITLAGEHFLSNYRTSVQRSVRHALERDNIQLLEGMRVSEVTSSRIALSGGREIDSDFTVWVVGASAPAWIAGSGLATDDRGFPAVDAFLRSKSDERVFAAGDIASLDSGVPKAGVYAVREGPVLTRNLLAVASGAPLERYVPQPRFLSLLSLGARRAIASWGPFKAEGALVWRLKDHIDRKFMRRYASA